MEDAANVLDEELVGWIRAVTGAATVRAERRSGGASRAGYAIDAVAADGTTQELWLRLDTGYGPQSGGVYTVRREGAVYRALAGTPVRVAQLLAIHPTLDAFLAERLTGRNWFAQITDPAEQESTARDFMDQLAAIHALLDTAHLRAIHCLPQPFHTFGLTLGYVASIVLDRPLVALEGRYGPAAVDHWLSTPKQGVLTLGAPTHFHDLVARVQGRGVTVDPSAASIVGGAPVTQEYADAVGADGYAADASATVKKAKELIARRRGALANA